MTKLIILDRDGVINKDLGTYVTKVDEFEFIDGVIDAIANLKKAGFIIAIATNQAGIERGIYSHETLSAIHAKMLNEIRAGGGDIDRIIYCPSYDNNHPWRKPNAGMLTELLNGFNIDASNAVFVGDSLTDMLAGEVAGCKLMMINGKDGKSEENQLDSMLKSKIQVFENLAQVTSWFSKNYDF